jgi:hypothetical protein
MTHYYADDECNECIHYVKPVANSNSWRCAICLIAESAICFDGETHLWDRYELACGHEVHERCYRTWAKSTNAVGCPSCGILKKVDSSRFCEVCDRFGHKQTVMCVVHHSREALLKHAVEAKEERAKYVPFSLN